FVRTDKIVYSKWVLWCLVEQFLLDSTKLATLICLHTHFPYSRAKLRELIYLHTQFLYSQAKLRELIQLHTQFGSFSSKLMTRMIRYRSSFKGKKADFVRTDKIVYSKWVLWCLVEQFLLDSTKLVTLIRLPAHFTYSHAKLRRLI
ncbi:MAG: hypothetical protein L0L57_08505, partial [Alkalibacterium sp.]|nr:hypothetical protein [Alkalibacterium sp.]